MFSGYRLWVIGHGFWVIGYGLLVSTLLHVISGYWLSGLWLARSE